MKFVKLTLPEGGPAYLSESGMLVRAATPTEAGRTRITFGQPVPAMESIEEVLRAFGEKPES